MQENSLKVSCQILIFGLPGVVIGASLVEKLFKEKANVVGIDNMNNYYDTKLKKDRLKILKQKKNFSFNKININNYDNKVIPDVLIAFSDISLFNNFKANTC